MDKIQKGKIIRLNNGLAYLVVDRLIYYGEPYVYLISESQNPDIILAKIIEKNNIIVLEKVDDFDKACKILKNLEYEI